MSKKKKEHNKRLKRRYEEQKHRAKVVQNKMQQVFDKLIQQNTNTDGQTTDSESV